MAEKPGTVTYVFTVGPNSSNELKAAIEQAAAAANLDPDARVETETDFVSRNDLLRYMRQHYTEEHAQVIVGSVWMLLVSHAPQADIPMLIVCTNSFCMKPKGECRCNVGSGNWRVSVASLKNLLVTLRTTKVRNIGPAKLAYLTEWVNTL